MFKLTINDAYKILDKIPQNKRLEYHAFICKAEQAIRIIKTLELENRYFYVSLDELPKPEILC
ncbi:hypothetical protein [Providencia phage PSTRCR_127]|nr:hypothetical protein [Providencia phage PSTRCR_127]QQV88886.1 hypothetical protein [Providencia phage PSTRCR_121]UGO50043.1 hypothetical protein RGZ1_12 [Morganella phage vB_MmoM_Rgz1]